MCYNEIMDTPTKVNYFNRHPLVKDFLSLVVFIICVVLGTIILNAFVFRSYNVVGSSMENTFHNEDRVIVNRLLVSWDHFLGKEYVPQRGDVIVFANGAASGPLTCEALSGHADQFLIKRVIAFPGERVVVKNGEVTVYNDEYPDGFHPDDDTRIDENNGPKTNSSGEVDMVVPNGELFVAGDNREGAHSLDSRSGLGTVPYCRVIGPVLMRIYPLNKISFF